MGEFTFLFFRYFDGLVGQQNTHNYHTECDNYKWTECALSETLDSDFLPCALHSRHYLMLRPFIDFLPPAGGSKVLHPVVRLPWKSFPKEASPFGKKGKIAADLGTIKHVRPLSMGGGTA